MSLQRDMYMAPVIKYLEEKKLTEAANKGIWKKVKKDILSMAQTYIGDSRNFYDYNDILIFFTPNDTINEFRTRVLNYLGVTELNALSDDNPDGAYTALSGTKFTNIEYKEEIMEIYPDTLTIYISKTK